MSSTARGSDLEERVFTLFDAEISAGQFLAKPECCSIFRQKAYYSRDRLSNIVFDVAIELALPGANVPSILWLIECKNYNHAVPVDDVEEFFTKVQQVAAAGAKAVLVSSSSFQRGAIEFARSKGIGLHRMLPETGLKWVLHRSSSILPKSGTLSRDGAIWSGLTQEDYYSPQFDLLCNIRDVFTYSLNDFLVALTSDTVDLPLLELIALRRSDSGNVAFLSPEEIEDRCRAIHSRIGYQGGAVSLKAVCEWQELEVGLTVLTDAVADRKDIERRLLGRISFNPPSISVFFDTRDKRRQRYTLAHELGHLILGHGEYLLAESVDDQDISGDCPELGLDEVQRLEWQANYFASCLLLPRETFLASALKKAREMNLNDRGYGLIFLDQQPINVQSHYILTSALRDYYEVSRTAVSIRLKNLGLLNELPN